MLPDSNPNYMINTDKVRRLMLKRADVLKADLYHALFVDPSEARYDELGNVYYVDTINQKTLNSS